MKDGTSDVGGQKRGRARESALPEECRREKNKSRRENTKSGARKRRTRGENQYFALKRGLYQRCNYAKCVVFTQQKATEIL